jgi:hypothetical protein
MWNPARFQSTAIKLLMKHMRTPPPALPVKKGARKKPTARPD